jgi:hypothetical protein
MKRKNLFLVGLGLVILMLIYYYNSDNYLLKLAKEKQKEKIDEYNRIEKLYLNEGTYIFNKKEKSIKHTNNQFGKATTKIIEKGYKKITFSFTSNELIIDYPYEWKEYYSNLDYRTHYHIREVIKFKNNWEFYVPNKLWVFYVLSWEIIDFKTGTVIVDVFEEYSKDIKEWQEISIQLSMGTEEKSPYFNSFWTFKTVGAFLYAQEQTDSYNLSFVPEYASNFKYQDFIDIYNIEEFKPRPSIEDLIKKFLNTDDKSINKNKHKPQQGV